MNVVADLTCNKSACATEVAVPEPAEENQVEEIGPSASAATLAPPAPCSVEPKKYYCVRIYCCVFLECALYQTQDAEEAL